jgi:hypothetical protein
VSELDVASRAELERLTGLSRGTVAARLGVDARPRRKGIVNSTTAMISEYAKGL